MALSADSTVLGTHSRFSGIAYQQLPPCEDEQERVVRYAPPGAFVVSTFGKRSSARCLSHLPSVAKESFRYILDHVTV